MRTVVSDFGDHSAASQINRVSDNEAAINGLNEMAKFIHLNNYQWWHGLKEGEPLDRNKGELLMLIVSEVAESMEGERKGVMDTHLPHRKMAEVELADALIRIFDYAGAAGYDLSGAMREKLIYNIGRADHKPEARLAPGGKSF
jgi:NTP pyrophosphatase (non-canonical NTP hydrolase)